MSYNLVFIKIITLYNLTAILMTKKNTPLRISVIREMQYLPWVFKYSSSMDKMLTVFGNLKNCFNHGFDVSNDVRGINVDFTLLSSDGFDRFDYNHKVFNGFLNRQKKKLLIAAAKLLPHKIHNNCTLYYSSKRQFMNR